MPPVGSPAVVVVDCGAHAVKAGFAGETNPRVVIPTCTATVKGQVTKRVGDQVAELRADPSIVTEARAHDRGHVTNIACLEAVLTRSFDQDRLGVSPSSSSLFMSEALFTPGPVGQAVDELVFEYYGFQSHARSPCAPVSWIRSRAFNPAGALEHSCIHICESAGPWSVPRAP